MGELRIRELEWIAGEKKTKATYRESGCVFNVDLSKVYFSPRLSFERMRIAKQVNADEVIINMFAGVARATLHRIFQPFCLPEIKLHRTLY